jgi:hypothetical protein
MHIPLVPGANNPRTESLITGWCGKAVSRSRRPYIAAFCMVCYYSSDVTRGRIYRDEDATLLLSFPFQGLGSTKSADEGPENDMLYMGCILKDSFDGKTWIVILP